MSFILTFETGTNLFTVVIVIVIVLVLKSDDRVTAQMIFIGSLQDQAER